MELLDELDEARALVERVEELHLELEETQQLAIYQMNSIDDSKMEEIAGKFQGLDSSGNCSKFSDLIKAYSDEIRTKLWNEA